MPRLKNMEDYEILHFENAIHLIDKVTRIEYFTEYEPDKKEIERRKKTVWRMIDKINKASGLLDS